MSVNKLATLELKSQKLSFSAGHFTIYSATERERLHGHNYQVEAQITTLVQPDGISFNYRIYNEKIRQLCLEVDNYFLMPTKSPYLKVEETTDLYIAHFNQEKIPFLKSDVKLLPVKNTTLEELSHWFIDQLVKDKESLETYHIKQIIIKVFNGPGQAGYASWQ